MSKYHFIFVFIKMWVFLFLILQGKIITLSCKYDIFSLKWKLYEWNGNFFFYLKYWFWEKVSQWLGAYQFYLFRLTGQSNPGIFLALRLEIHATILDSSSGSQRLNTNLILYQMSYHPIPESLPFDSFINIYNVLQLYSF